MINLDKVVKKGVYETARRHFREKLAQRKNFLRLDLNENLTELSAAQFADMIASIKPDTVTAYPDLAPIDCKMARHVGVSEDRLVITNGSDMGIKSIFDVCIEKGDHIVLHDPYFLMYERYAQFFEADIDAVPVNDSWAPEADAMLRRVNARTKMVVVEDPSGNLGTGLGFQDLERMASELERKNVLLVIDEAYLYVEKNKSDNLALVDKYSNVILIRTMSKAYGLAGARLGILISNASLAKELYKVRSLYEISGLSANITEWHLDHPEVLAAYQYTVRKSKAFLFDQFKRLGLAFKDTPANFVTVELDRGNHTTYVAEQLKAKGILIGKAYTLPKLKGWARITVGEIKHCEQFIQALGALLDDRKQAA
jgi:histidinol-phosphate aminotransferase